MSFSVRHVPVLSDNYAYILVCDATKEAALVDPAECDKVLSTVQLMGVNVCAVLTTHHHEDHAGGNADVAKRLNVPVFGGDDRVQALSNKVSAKDVISVGKLAVQVLETPCHTSGSVSYLVEGGGRRAVFTGDTLFLGGCGRFFEGTAPQMQRALNEVLGALPDDTLVYCGHEYTEVLAFAFVCFCSKKKRNDTNKKFLGKSQIRPSCRASKFGYSNSSCKR